MLSFIPVLLLSSFSIAAPVKSKSGASRHPIEDVLNNLNGGITRTEKDLKSWRGDAASADHLFQDAYFLLNDIRQGAITAQQAPQVSIIDGGWLSPAIKLDNNLDSLVTTVIGAKNRVEKIGRTADLANVLGQMKYGVDDLVKNIFAKLPTFAQPLARPVTNQITGKVDKALKAYNGQTWNPIAGGFAIPKPQGLTGGNNWWSGSTKGHGTFGGYSSAPPQQQAPPAWGNSQPPPAAQPAWAQGPPAAQPAWAQGPPVPQPQPQAGGWGATPPAAAPRPW